MKLKIVKLVKYISFARLLFVLTIFTLCTSKLYNKTYAYDYQLEEIPTISITDIGNSPTYIAIGDEIFYGPFLIASNTSKLAENDSIIINITDINDYGISITSNEFIPKRSFNIGDLFYIKIPKHLENNLDISVLNLEAKGVKNIITPTFVQDIHFSDARIISLANKEITQSQNLSSKDIPQSYNYPIFAFNNGEEDSYEEENINQDSNDNTINHDNTNNFEDLHYAQNSTTNELETNILLDENTAVNNINQQLNNKFDVNTMNNDEDFKNNSTDIYGTTSETNSENIINTTENDFKLEGQISSSENNLDGTINPLNIVNETDIIDINNSLVTKENPKTMDKTISNTTLILVMYAIGLILSSLIGLRKYIIKNQ